MSAHSYNSKYIFLNLCFRWPSIVGYDNKPWKWTIVMRGPTEPADVIELTTYVCIGNQDMVADCLMVAAGI